MPISRTITLKATAPKNNGGKEYIARLIGRHKKYVFEREFVGAKKGEVKELCEYLTDEPGLYQIVDLDETGKKHERMVLLVRTPLGGLEERPCSREDAMLLCRILDKGLLFDQAVREMYPGCSNEERDRRLAELFKDKEEKDAAKFKPHPRPHQQDIPF